MLSVNLSQDFNIDIKTETDFSQDYFILREFGHISFNNYPRTVNISKRNEIMLYILTSLDL